MYNAAYCDMALLLFHKTNHRYLKSNTRLQVFLCRMIPTLFQLYSNFSQLFGKTELFKITLEPCNYLKPLYIKYCSNFIVQKIQLNRAKFIFNRAEKKKPNTREGVRPFPTSKRTTTLMIYK